MKVNRKNFLTVTIGLVFCFLLYFTAASIIVVAPTTNTLANYSNITGTVTLNVSVPREMNVSNVTFMWLNATGYTYNVTIVNDTLYNDVVFNTTFNTALLPDGIYNITIQAVNLTGVGDSNLTNITYFIRVDNTYPQVHNASFIYGSLGWGRIDNSNSSNDEFFSAANENKYLNISINLTDLTTGVKNVTFNFTTVCGVDNSAATLVAGIWYANCTINVTAVANSFAQYTIPYTACDYVGLCNSSLYRTIWLYNFTVPAAGGIVLLNGSLTTNLTKRTNLNTVNYVLDLSLNGNVLPGTPWSGYQRAVIINFTTLNFTSSTIGTKLAGLATALNVNISAPRSYGINRIYVNSTFFSELNTTANITLYNLPFVAQPNITVDNDGAGNVIKVQTWVAGLGANGPLGNLTFSVTGFSGYNVTDNVNPIVTVHSPVAHNVTIANVGTLFNFTFNGTGTEVDNSSINVTLTKTSNIFATIITYFNYTNMTCTQTNETMMCNTTFNLTDGSYSLVASIKDYGGTAGNTGTATVLNISSDLVAPYVKFNTVNGMTNGSWNNTPRSLLTNIIVGDANINYWNVSVYHDNGTIIAMNQTAGFTSNSALVNLSYNTDANYTLNLTAYDYFGRSNSTLFLIKIDTVIPGGSLSCTASPVTQGNTFSCACSATDALSGVASQTFTSRSEDTASLGTFTSTACVIYDNAGNSYTVSGTTYNVIASTGGGNAGGGGSSGGVSTSITGEFEKKVWTSINAGETATVPVANGKIGITEVKFIADKTAYGAWVKVEKLDSLPSSVSSFTNKAYSKIEITSGNIAANLQGTAKIKFKVTNSWLTENKLSANKVALFRYADGKWTQLATTLGDNDGTYTHYTAETPGFSYFVIGEAKAAVTTSTAKKTDITAPTAETTATGETLVTEETTAPVEEAIIKAKSYRWLWVSLVIAAIIVLLIVYYKLKKKPEPIKPRRFK